MKKLRLIAIALFASTLIFVGCEKTEDGTYVAPITLYEKVSGSWRLSRLIMSDEDAKRNNIRPNEEVITNVLGFSTFTIELNVDQNNRPTTYKVGGNAPNLFAPEGYWDLSSDFPRSDLTPVIIRLYSDAERTNLIDQLSIAQIPSQTLPFEFRLTRSVNQIPFLTYLYRLNRN